MEITKIIQNSFIITLILVSIVLVLQNHQLVDDYNEIATQCNTQKCQLYNSYQYLGEKPVATGIYWIGEDYYCVWAKDRNLTEIETTERHEHCHYLVDNDYEHFCLNGVVMLG